MTETSVWVTLTEFILLSQNFTTNWSLIVCTHFDVFSVQNPNMDTICNNFTIFYFKYAHDSHKESGEISNLFCKLNFKSIEGGWLLTGTTHWVGRVSYSGLIIVKNVMYLSWSLTSSINWKITQARLSSQ